MLGFLAISRHWIAYGYIRKRSLFERSRKDGGLGLLPVMESHGMDCLLMLELGDIGGCGKK